MATIISVRGFNPSFGKECFLSCSATIVGDVTVGDKCSFWFNSVVRGDVNSIRIGNFSNIQDGAVIHATYEKTIAVIGDYVSIGHNAIVHGCEIKNHVLVGMGAIVMDNARVEEYCIIAAGAVVLEGMICEKGSLYAGIPARKIKEISPEQKEGLNQTPINYTLYSSWFLNKN